VAARAPALEPPETDSHVIPFFTGYVVIVWWLAAKYRRTWRAFAWVGAGAAFMALVIVGHTELGVATNGKIYVPVLQPILYAYGLTVTGMGLYIACLPRRPEPGRLCHWCGYDMLGLDPADAQRRTCPECGRTEPEGSAPTHNGHSRANHKHARRQPEGQPQADHPQRALVQGTDRR
jgi:hypothetical protein